MRIGFIGCGNMGSALARSVMKSVSAFHIVINDVNKEKVNALCTDCMLKLANQISEEVEI